jgi:hypothetical protein
MSRLEAYVVALSFAKTKSGSKDEENPPNEEGLQKSHGGVWLFERNTRVSR